MGIRARRPSYLCTLMKRIRHPPLCATLLGSLVGAAIGVIVQLSRERVAWAMVQEQPGRVERRLSAILAVDVAGYSRLMHDDEEATHARFTMLLTDAVEPSIAQHGGRVVKNTGDGIVEAHDIFVWRWRQYRGMS